jgi:hypothetical protein
VATTHVAPRADDTLRRSVPHASAKKNYSNCHFPRSSSDFILEIDIAPAVTIENRATPVLQTTETPTPRSVRALTRTSAPAPFLRLLRFPNRTSWIPDSPHRHEAGPGPLSYHWRKQRDGRLTIIWDHEN